MSQGRIYIPEELRTEVEKVQQRYGDEKLSQAARRILRVGLKELLRTEEGA
jgi:predicted nucleic acid-binding OB-fold protein